MGTLKVWDKAFLLKVIVRGAFDLLPETMTKIPLQEVKNAAANQRPGNRLACTANQKPVFISS